MASDVDLPRQVEELRNRVANLEKMKVASPGDTVFFTLPQNYTHADAQHFRDTILDAIGDDLNCVILIGEIGLHVARRLGS
jgi:hypothetical protein